MHAGNQFQLRFTEIGGDVRMGQRRAQCDWMGLERQRAIRGNPQAFLFYAVSGISEPLRLLLAESD